jgi:hypothetical protein
MKKILAITFVFWALAASVLVLSGSPPKDGDLSEAQMATTLGSGCCSLVKQTDCKGSDECVTATQKGGADPGDPPACPSGGKDYENVDRYTCSSKGDPNMKCDPGDMTCYQNQTCSDGGKQVGKKASGTSCTSDVAYDCRACSGGDYTGGSGTKSDDTCVAE